jgi:DNA-binding transcriptional regulator YhcF (GntR family)
MIDILDEPQYRGISSHGYRLVVHLLREADREGDLAKPLSLPRSTLAAWLGVSRATTHRITTEIEALGLIRVTHGRAKSKDDPGKAATYTIRLTDALGGQEPSHQRDGSEADPSHQREHTYPPEPTDEEDSRAGARTRVQFLNDLHQRLSTDHGPGWAFMIDDDLSTSVAACLDAGMSEEEIHAACDKAGGAAKPSPRVWRFYASVLDNELRDRAKATETVSGSDRYEGADVSDAMREMGMTV